MASRMGDEIVEDTDMTDDAITNNSGRADSLIRSETASFYGDSPFYTFATIVDSAKRSSCASYEADYDAHNSTTSNVPSHEPSHQEPHNSPYCQTLTQQPHFQTLFQHSNEALQLQGVMRAQRMRWTTTLRSRFVHAVQLLGALKINGWIDGKTLDPTNPGTGMAIAVRRNAHQGFSELLATEIKYLGQLCHPNLIKLIGYSSGTIYPSLVYEFMAKAASECETLSWTIRMKVVRDTAQALAFLHELHLIYRDFKPSHILLDSNYNAKLSNFGLVINGAEEDEISTSIAGTFGYLDLAYFRTGLLSKKSDVYGFGVVLLELISGKRVLGRYGPNGDDLVEWAKPLLIDRKGIIEVMDSRIFYQYSDREAERIAHLAIQCLSDEQELRPTMDEVGRVLEHL